MKKRGRKAKTETVFPYSPMAPDRYAIRDSWNIIWNRCLPPAMVPQIYRVVRDVCWGQDKKAP